MLNKKSLGDKLFDGFNFFILGVLCISIIFPFWQQIVISLSPPEEAAKIGLHIFTTKPTLDSYSRIFLTDDIKYGYIWTTLRTVLSLVLSVSVTAMLAYPLSKKNFVFRKLWMNMVVFTMFFSGGLIPTFLLVKELHLLNTIWALVLPGLCSAWNIIIIRNFFSSLPDELEESAKIDGANEARIFFTIILPLSKPIIATVSLWTMVGNWNSWFDAMIYMTDGKIKVLQIVLKRMLDEATAMNTEGIDQTTVGVLFTPESIKAATLMAVVIPILSVYPFLQKYFVKGIMIGAVKG